MKHAYPLKHTMQPTVYSTDVLITPKTICTAAKLDDRRVLVYTVTLSSSHLHNLPACDDSIIIHDNKYFDPSLWYLILSLASSVSDFLPPVLRCWLNFVCHNNSKMVAMLHEIGICPAFLQQGLPANNRKNTSIFIEFCYWRDEAEGSQLITVHHIMCVPYPQGHNSSVVSRQILNLRRCTRTKWNGIFGMETKSSSANLYIRCSDVF